MGSAQTWRDGDLWLHTRYEGAVHVATDRWIEGSEIVLDAERNDYNLEPYNEPGLPPILAWDHDVLIRVFFERVW